jgi:hypothetical protein
MTGILHGHGVMAVADRCTSIALVKSAPWNASCLELGRPRRREGTAAPYASRRKGWSGCHLAASLGTMRASAGISSVMSKAQ